MFEEIDDELFNITEPILIEVCFDKNTYVLPKLEFGKPNQDQEPLLGRETFERIMHL